MQGFKIKAVEFITADRSFPKKVSGKIYEGRVFSRMTQVKASGYKPYEVVRIFTEKGYEGYITRHDLKHNMQKGVKHEKNNS